MEKERAEKLVFIVFFIAIILLFIFFFSSKVIINGKATAPPPQTHPAKERATCGNGNCEGSEDYYNCPQDCCGEENMQVRTSNSCCEGLTAVQDICEFEWPKEEEAELPVIPPSLPSAEAIREFPTGHAVAPPAEIPEKHCWFCVNCGNGICGKHETGENCPIDCAICGNGVCEGNESYENCPQDCCAKVGYRGPSPVKCCEGLIAVDPCDVENPPSYCTITIKQEACINCGDGKCDEYETVKNCPEDCLPVLMNCEELPKLDVNLVTLDHKMKFVWNPRDILQGAPIFLQTADSCIGEKCEFEEEEITQSISVPGEYEVPLPEDNLKFYRLIAKVKIGPGSCEPLCVASCGPLQVEGWCDPCTNTLLKAADCWMKAPPATTEAVGISGKKAHCCFVNTRSQGWYDISCDKATSENLIVYDQKCHLPSQICDQTSNLLVKFTQEFKQPTTGVARTSINWMNFLNVWGIQDSEQLMRIGALFDYVAYWDPEKQQQFGTAEGDPKWVCKNGGKGGCCYLDRVFTGVFTMEKGKPYFVSLRQPVVKMHYVGKVPEHVTFNLKRGVNYIALPLNTRIRKASQLCDIRDSQGNQILDQSKTIVEWDVSSQREINAGTGETCYNILQDPENDFELEPKIYKITVTRDPSWTQL
ncbi:MAG: hypothetical protein N3G19_02315 [Candidatus Pacearchaeota archaeon]|nr:hypothetical protein [Candidatus Pacearchaeota archaeon]